MRLGRGDRVGRNTHAQHQPPQQSAPPVFADQHRESRPPNDQKRNGTTQTEGKSDSQGFVPDTRAS